MKTREVCAVAHFKHGYLVDACAGGTYCAYESDAMTFATPQAAQEAMTAAELGKLGVDYEVVPLQEIERFKSLK
jgi:hypothetical protein